MQFSRQCRDSLQTFFFILKGKKTQEERELSEEQQGEEEEEGEEGVEKDHPSPQ